MRKINSLEKKRIFWLGMHKLLVTTELQRLRILGYEVFNPPYLSSIIDQSAALGWSPPTDSTLPAEAIAILSQTNFFYAAIPPEAAEILNQYFEIAIVTIHPNWLKSFLSAYHGKIIYRVYGQPYRLSEHMANNHTLDLISERENFWFCPHHEASLHIEDPWLKYLNIKIIPYCLSNDIMELKDHWLFQDVCPEYDSMGLLCPRILDNTYYYHYYKHIEAYFTGDQFKIFGVQILPVSNTQVVGTLKREEFLKLFIKLRGFIYHYPESSICYLPPIEFMTLGGPVIFLKGCLLSRYFNGLSAPGEVRDLAALATLAQRLKKGDRTLSDEIINSQEKVRTLYDPNYVWPIFDKTMTEILNTNQTISPLKLLYNHTTAQHVKENLAAKKSFVIVFHSLGPNIEQNEEGIYYSAEGIVRVTRLMAKVLSQSNQVIVTSRRCDFGKIHGFFASCITDPSKLKILLIDQKNNFLLGKVSNKVKSASFRVSLLRRIINKLTRLLKAYKNQPIHLSLKFISAWCHIIKRTSISYVESINQDKSIAYIIVPHYSLFPEVGIIKKPILLYLPDYLPHFYKNLLAMGDHWTCRYTGKKLARKAKLILTNSNFTRNYLPNSVLKVKKEKIVCFPLAYLNQSQKIDDFSNTKKIIKNLPELFIFYPTRDRASKRLNDFLTIVNIVNTRLKKNNEIKRVYGVLTTKLLSKKQSDQHIIYLPTLSDLDLTIVYKLASALVFTSENEGNFPTQINEALYLNTPVIATNIPQVTNELGQTAQFLQLIDVGDCEKFADAILYTLDNKAKILTSQQKAHDYAMRHFSYKQFSTNFLSIFS